MAPTNNFDSLNLKVCPIQDPVGFKKRPNINGHLVRWNQEENWCDWKERNTIYPDVHDWYVLPGGKVQYYDCIEWGYYILDIDRGHTDKEKDPEKWAEEEARYNWSIHILDDVWKIPKTLRVRSASGGLHIYYKAPAEFLPRQCTAVVDGKPTAIEVKVNTGWVAPNGRDRTVEEDNPVAVFYPVAGDEFSKSVERRGPRRAAREYIEDPTFNISTFPIPEATEGNRHPTLLGCALQLRAYGCPYDAYYDWAVQFFEKNGREPQPHEIENAWQDNRTVIPPTIVERSEEDLKELQADLDPLAGAVELTGREAIEAKAVFATEEEKVKLRKEWLASK